MTIPTPVKCQRCGYTWLYKGKLYRCTCPRCGTTVMVANSKVTVDQYVKSLLFDEEEGEDEVA